MLHNNDFCNFIPGLGLDNFHSTADMVADFIEYEKWDRQTALKRPVGNTPVDRPMVFVLLCNGYCVPQAFYDSILSQVREVLPALIPGETYTLKMLCGPDYWDPLDDGDRRIAGRCMADMVAKNLLPLRFAKSKHEYPKCYQIA